VSTSGSKAKALVVEFLRSALPDQLRRRLDVSDFGTPVRSISTFQSGDRVRMVVEPTGAWEHSAYQSDNQFVLEVRPVKIDPNKLTQGAGFQGEKLSLNFQNIEVRALLQVIADFTNFNVVTSDTVTGTVTLRLKDVPWDQALDIIMQAKGLGVRKSGNVLWVAPKEELANKEQVELETKKKIAELEPLRTQSFPAELRQVRRSGCPPDWAVARWRRQPRGHRFRHPRQSNPFRTRQCLSGTAHQSAVRERHAEQAGRDPAADRQDRHCRAPGADRSPHRGSR
jgi:type II secretory pathway component HofQ